MFVKIGVYAAVQLPYTVCCGVMKRLRMSFSSVLDVIYFFYTSYLYLVHYEYYSAL